MTWCCRWFIQPAIETTRNENGSKTARIAAAYHAEDLVLPLAASRIEFLDHTGEHRLKLELRRTAPRLCGEIISAVALVVLFAACCFDGGPFPNSKRGRPILLPLLV